MRRIFKIGGTELVDTPQTEALTVAEMTVRLADTFPEAKTATVKETQHGDDTWVEYTAAPGHKG